jgi:voltage-gated potassium channel Kch
MVKQLLLALLLCSTTVLIHAFGIRYVALPLAGVWSKKVEGRASVVPVMPLVRLVSGLLLLHLLEMSIWAAAFTVLAILPDFETSLYFSLKSYTTVGYGDVVPPHEWRLVGPIEAAVGVLMLGLSTSFIIATLQRIHFLRSQPNDHE